MAYKNPRQKYSRGKKKYRGKKNARHGTKTIITKYRW